MTLSTSPSLVMTTPWLCLAGAVSHLGNGYGWAWGVPGGAGDGGCCKSLKKLTILS
jgi:hypothetical protein